MLHIVEKQFNIHTYTLFRDADVLYIIMDLLCKSHNAPVPYTYISVTNLRIVGYLFDSLRDLWDGFIPRVLFYTDSTLSANAPLARYVKIRVAHAPGMPGTFSPAANFKRNYYIAIPACITARAWRTCRDACRDRLPAVTGKTFPAFPAHAHPQFCVSGKRPMVTRSAWTSTDIYIHSILSNVILLIR